MELGHVVHHLGIELEEDQEALQRVVGQLARPLAQRVEDLVVLGEEALEQLAGEVVLVA